MLTKTRSPNVLNIHTDPEAKTRPDSVYIGRPSKWGNPFVIGKDGSRRQVVAKYRDYLLDHPELVQAAQRELTGKNLVCYCAPDACHGDVLLELANQRPLDTPRTEAPQRVRRPRKIQYVTSLFKDFDGAR